jgi:hypothetical protein
VKRHRTVDAFAARAVGKLMQRLAEYSLSLRQSIQCWIVRAKR